MAFWENTFSIFGEIDFLIFWILDFRFCILLDFEFGFIWVLIFRFIRDLDVCILHFVCCICLMAPQVQLSAPKTRRHSP